MTYAYDPMEKKNICIETLNQIHPSCSQGNLLRVNRYTKEKTCSVKLNDLCKTESTQDLRTG